MPSHSEATDINGLKSKNSSLQYHQTLAEEGYLKMMRSGDVGAVLYDGETTLKKIQKEDDRLRLKPANPDYDDIVIEPG